MVCAMLNLFNRAWSDHRGGPAHRPRPGRSRTPRAAVFTSVGATALVFLTACGGGDGGDADKSSQGEVASINTPAAGGGSAPPSADPDAGRPQIRLDSTQDEINRMMDAWLACLKENGVEKTYKKSPNSPGVKACQGKEPLDPPELDPAKNPDYSDDVRIMVKCMNEHGIRSVVVEGGWGLEEGASMSAPNYDETLTACQVKAFGGDE